MPFINKRNKPLVVWCFQDDKPGHINQTRGLLAALEREKNLETYEISASEFGSPLSLLYNWLIRKLPSSCPAAPPDLILGAGHLTHLPMLLARSITGGKTAVLMKPTLPVRLFDLVIAPEHDALQSADNVILTKGVLNSIEYSGEKSTQHGLILIGGESRHFTWNDEQVIEQILLQVNNDPYVQWLLTTSRRTPRSFLQKLTNQALSNQLEIVPCEQTESGWLNKKMAWAGQIWVTPDSVSMVYEALTSGSSVGLYNLDGRNGRIKRQLDHLTERGYVTSFQEWMKNKALKTPTSGFNEANRVAELILERWFES